MRIELNCAVCGGNNFKLDEMVDEDAQVVCDDCGHEIGSMAELQKMLAEEVLKRARPQPSA